MSLFHFYDVNNDGADDLKGDDWALHSDGKIYGIDGNTLEIWDVQNNSLMGSGSS